MCCTWIYCIWYIYISIFMNLYVFYVFIYLFYHNVLCTWICLTLDGFTLAWLSTGSHQGWRQLGGAAAAARRAALGRGEAQLRRTAGLGVPGDLEPSQRRRHQRRAASPDSRNVVKRGTKNWSLEWLLKILFRSFWLRGGQKHFVGIWWGLMGMVWHIMGHRTGQRHEIWVCLKCCIPQLAICEENDGWTLVIITR